VPTARITPNSVKLAYQGGKGKEGRKERKGGKTRVSASGRTRARSSSQSLDDPVNTQGSGELRVKKRPLLTTTLDYSSCKTTKGEAQLRGKKRKVGGRE